MNSYHRRSPIDPRDKDTLARLVKSTVALVNECEPILPNSHAAKCRSLIRELTMIAYDIGFGNGYSATTDQPRCTLPAAPSSTPPKAANSQE